VKRVLPIALIAAGLVAYAVTLFFNISYAAAGADTSGYLNLAKMLSGGRVSYVIEPIRMFGLTVNEELVRVFTPIGFTWGKPGSGTMAPGYPPGLPIHLVVAAAIGGWDRAPYYVSPIAAIGCLFMMYLVGRSLGLSSALSVGGAAILAALPQFLAHALQPVSDIVATFWSLVAIWCALESLRRPALAFASGAAFAIGVWVRPTGIVLLIPLAIALRFRVSLIVRACVAAFPFAVGLMYYHLRTYGSVFTTGYGPISYVFSTTRLAECVRVFSRWLFKFLPVVFPLGLLVALDKRVTGWHRALLPIWFSTFFVLYSFWAPYDEWWSLRFLLPGTPALILGAILLLRDLFARRVWIAYALIAVLVAVPLYWNRQYAVLMTDEWESIYPEVVHWAEPQLPPNAMIVSGSLSGAFFYYSGRFSARVDQLTDEHFQLLRAHAGHRGLRWYAVLSDGEPEYHTLSAKLRGNWTLVGKHRHASIWRLDS
jgi:hypothetical protein